MTASDNSRTATCSCGALRVALQGPPRSVSVCHCRACQKQTGSAFGVAVFWPRTASQVDGDSHIWTRPGTTGHSIDFHFCPTCGSTVFWHPGFKPDAIAVAIGALDDTSGLKPAASYWEETRQTWLDTISDLPGKDRQ